MNRLINGVASIVMAVILLATGIFLLVMGIGRFQAISAGKFQETQATITQIETRRVPEQDRPDRIEYDITVEYEVDGKKVVSQLDTTPKEFHEGMELAVQYNMDNPTEVTLPGNGGAFIMMVMGVVALLGCAFLILQKLRGH